MAGRKKDPEPLEPTVVGSRQGHDGPPMTADQIAQRNSEIVAAKLRGIPWSTISETFGVSPRQCKNIMKQYRETNPTLRHHDPVDIVDELLEGYQGIIEELALVSARSNNDAVRVGAINAKMSAYGKVAELLQAIGVLPHDLGQLRVVIDGRMVAESVVDVLREFREGGVIEGQVMEELEDRLIEALEGNRKLLTAGT
jgi:DNA-binding Lrp family transcriptional regulator